MFPKILLAALFSAVSFHAALAAPEFNVSPANPKVTFVENKGQVKDQFNNARTDIDFKIPAGNNLNVFVGNAALHYQWFSRVPSATAQLQRKETNAFSTGITTYRMDVKLVGANTHARMSTEQAMPYYESYFGQPGITAGVFAKAYGKVVYHEVYPNIDWVLYINGEGLLEYDFVIRPGGKVSDIKLNYKGAVPAINNDNGDLIAATPLGSVTERAPKAYDSDGKVIAVRFELESDILRFTTQSYNGILTIDPTIKWGSYFGGNDNDLSYGITTSKDGFIYVTGGTNSMANIATTGAFQTVYGGGTAYLGNDAYLSKFDSSGTCLWSTYYGGANEDVALSICTDTSGNVYFAGYTAGSTGMATSGSYQSSPAGGYDAFLAKFTPSGSRLWATYYGGAGDDCWGGPMAITCDKENNVYLAGTTQSTGLATPGAAQTIPGDYEDAFLAKFNSAGQRQWATYLGGEGADFASGVAVDTSLNIYLCGSTNSIGGIATGGSFQPANAGDYDGFLARYNSAGQKTWATYIGGSDWESVRSITCDNTSGVFVGGATASTSGIASPGSFQSVYGGGYEDAFLAKFDAGGSRVWATYYGGMDIDDGVSIQVNTDGHIFFAGLTSSSNAVALGGVQDSVGGSSDAFVAKFSGSGSLEWGSYYGGFDWDQAYGVALDGHSNIYLAGYTLSATGIATPGAHQVSYSGGDGDGFIVRIKDCQKPNTPDTINGRVRVCAGTVNLYSIAPPSNDSFYWILPDGWSGSSDSSSIAATSSGSGGTLKVIAVNDCDNSDTVSLNIIVDPLPDMPVIVRSGNVLSLLQAYAGYQWNLNGQPVNGATGATYFFTTEGAYSVTVTNEEGCSVTSDAVEGGTGIGGYAKENVIPAYPNPTDGMLYIMLSGKASYSISDMEGRQLVSGRLHPGTNSLDLRAYSSNIYLLSIYDPAGALIGVQKVTKVSR